MYPCFPGETMATVVQLACCLLTVLATLTGWLLTARP